MKTSDINTNLINSYFTILISLSPSNKLDLIAKLNESISVPQKEEDTSLKKLFGALELDQSADNFIEDLKKDRKFSRKPVVYFI